jgi:NAD(P)H-dependent FMN reductase
MKILILSSSVRTGRNSHRVARYFQKKVSEVKDVEVEIFDLDEADFPLFKERLSHQDEPVQELNDYAEKVDKADAVIFVIPEYNGGYPAAWKNAFDLLYDEWKDKPAGIVSVSAGSFGGTQVQVQVQWVISKVGMINGGLFPVPNVTKNFSEEGEALDEAVHGRADRFIEGLIKRIG